MRYTVSLFPGLVWSSEYKRNVTSLSIVRALQKTRFDKAPVCGEQSWRKYRHWCNFCTALEGCSKAWNSPHPVRSCSQRTSRIVQHPIRTGSSMEKQQGSTPRSWMPSNDSSRTCLITPASCDINPFSDTTRLLAPPFSRKQHRFEHTLDGRTMTNPLSSC